MSRPPRSPNPADAYEGEAHEERYVPAQVLGEAADVLESDLPHDVIGEVAREHLHIEECSFRAGVRTPGERPETENHHGRAECGIYAAA